MAAFQDNINIVALTDGPVYTDVNLTFALTLYPSGRNNYAVLFVKMAPMVLENDRYCEDSSAVRVTCTDVDNSGNPIEWYFETQDPDNAACVSQDPLAHTADDPRIKHGNLSFGFTVSLIR